MPIPSALLEHLCHKRRWFLGLRFLCIATALLIPLLTVWVQFGGSVFIYASLLFGILILTFRQWDRADSNIRPDSLAEHLNRSFPELEESSQLLATSDEPRSSLAKRQQTKIGRVLTELDQAGHIQTAMPKAQWLNTFLILTLSSMFSFALAYLPQSNDNHQSSTSEKKDFSQSRNVLRVVRVSVQAPTYTKVAEAQFDQLDIKVPEGSNVHWQLGFARPVSRLIISFQNRPNLEVFPHASTVSLDAIIKHRDIYRITWWDEAGEYTSDFHQLSVVADLPPELLIQTPKQSPALVAAQSPGLAEFVIFATDDYQIQDSVIVVTVAKGQGEQVSFRDQNFNFDNVARTGDGLLLRKTWDLNKMGMEPGDELYFRAKVWDNKPNKPNLTQTATLLLRWESIEEPQSLAIDGIAVDLIPEYFRSQRQIIIDTENLIETRSDLSEAEFNNAMQALAFDQKSLRIRYGQYLGEEYETDIGFSQDQLAEQLESEQGDETDHDHDHDNETEHFGHNDTDSATAYDLSAFVHAHDSAEQATLFDEATKGTLKAALNAMWQAELALHLYQADTALPHEYQALRELKAVQQAARIYVKRVGFEPPPLDSGKQLSGDLSEVNSQFFKPKPVINRTPIYHQILNRLDIESGSMSISDDLKQDLQRLIREQSLLLPQEQTDLDLELALIVAKILNQSEGEDCRECFVILHNLLWQFSAVPKLRASVPLRNRWSAAGGQYLETLSQ